MKLMVALLLVAAVGVGGLYYWQSRRPSCSNVAFGVMGNVRYCENPDGTGYLDGVPSPPPGSTEPAATPSP